MLPPSGVLGGRAPITFFRNCEAVEPVQTTLGAHPPRFHAGARAQSALPPGATTPVSPVSALSQNASFESTAFSFSKQAFGYMILKKPFIFIIVPVAQLLIEPQIFAQGPSSIPPLVYLKSVRLGMLGAFLRTVGPAPATKRPAQKKSVTYDQT